MREQSTALAVVEQAPALTDLVSTATQEHTQVLVAAAGMVEHAIRAGEALLAAKARIPRGQWESWAGEKIPQIGHATRQGYMRVALHQDRVRAASAKSIEEALRLLRDPSKVNGQRELDEGILNLVAKREMRAAEAARQLGVNPSVVRYRVDKIRGGKKMRRDEQRRRAARRALREKERVVLARKVGGPTAVAYSHIRRALQALEKASHAHRGDARRESTLAAGHVASAEELVARAMTELYRAETRVGRAMTASDG